MTSQGKMITRAKKSDMHKNVLNLVPTPACVTPTSLHCIQLKIFPKRVDV